MHRISGPRGTSAPTRTSRTDCRVFLVVEELEGRIAPAVLTPVQVRHAYGFDQITFTGPSGQAIRGDGNGQTIAIVSAYNNARIASDLDTFDRAFSINGTQTLYAQYGAASKFLTVANPQGTPLNDTSGLWTLETALDVEWAHAIAPGSRILLVQARSSSFYDLMGAVAYARKQPGVVVVSMSWGAKEFAGQTSYDGYFTTPAGHWGGSDGLGGARLTGGVTFVAASGDAGAPALWPATSANVLAVGGTTLGVDAYGNYLRETTWVGSGGGYSKQVREPAYQLSYQKSGWRTTPDVAYNADPSSSVYVYSSYKIKGYSGWFGVGGTSAGAPQWAALVAIADQGRALAGKGSLDGPTQTLPALYAFAAADFHDILSGSNGYQAAAGYDLATGRGSPFANRVVKDLVATNIKTAAPKTTSTTLPKVSASVLAQTFFVFTGSPGPGRFMPSEAREVDGHDTAFLILRHLQTDGIPVSEQRQFLPTAPGQALVSDGPVGLEPRKSMAWNTPGGRAENGSEVAPFPTILPVAPAPALPENASAAFWASQVAVPPFQALDACFAEAARRDDLARVDASTPVGALRPHDRPPAATMSLLGLAFVLTGSGSHVGREAERRGAKPWPTQ